MAANPVSDVWALRENTALSEHAKIAYLMLWSRGKDIRPSMRTLAANMSTSVRTARNAVRELETAGLLKTATRMSRAGDNDTNQYDLLPVLGEASPAAPEALNAEPGTAPRAGKERTIKDKSEGRNSLASRRAPQKVTRGYVIKSIRSALETSYLAVEYEDLTDSQIMALWYAYTPAAEPPAHPVAYFCKIFGDAPSLDTLLAKSGDEDDWLLAALAS